MTPETTAAAAAGARRSDIRLDIRRVTLHGYSPAARDQYARELAGRLARRGVPSDAAVRAADAILDAVDARLGAAGGHHG